MDRSLWLLTGLRIKGRVRRLVQNVQTIKGAILAVVGGLAAFACLTSWVLSLFVIPKIPARPERLDMVMRIGPLSLLAVCILSLITSSANSGVIPFSSAEVNYLFAGPYHRRQLLSYKLIQMMLTILVSSIFFLMGVWYAQVADVPIGIRYLGVVLALAFAHLLAVALGFLAKSIGARAYSRLRRLLLALGAASLGLALILSVRDWTNLDAQEVLLRLEQSSIVQTILEPFCWFVRAFTARQWWPDFARWGGICLAINACLVIVIYILDADYLESAAVASERLYAQVQRLRRGGAAALLASTGKPRFSLPMLPWLRGAGPVAWRQMLAVPRSRATIVFVFLQIPVLAPLLSPGIRGHLQDNPGATIALCSEMIWFSMFMTFLVTFDFRGDLDRMDVLKGLPIGVVALAAGELVTPVLFCGIFQALDLAIIGMITSERRLGRALFAAIPFVIPFNLVVYGIDNLMFLLFPSRALRASPGDFQFMGREILITLARFTFLGIALAIAGLVGVLVYFVTGESLVSAVTTSWFALTALAGSLVPAIAVAFRKYDVSRDTPPE